MLWSPRVLSPHLRGGGTHFWEALGTKIPTPRVFLGLDDTQRLPKWGIRVEPGISSRILHQEFGRCRSWLVGIHTHFPFCMEEKANKLFHRMFLIYLTHPTNFLEPSKYIFIISWAFLYNYHGLLATLTASLTAALIYKIISFGCLLLPIKTYYEPGRKKKSQP